MTTFLKIIQKALVGQTVQLSGHITFRVLHVKVDPECARIGFILHTTHPTKPQWKLTWEDRFEIIGKPTSAEVGSSY